MKKHSGKTQGKNINMIQYTVKKGKPESQSASCIIVGIFHAGVLSPTAATIDLNSQEHISKIIKRGDMQGKIGQSLLLHNVPGIKAESVLLIGCGEQKTLQTSDYRKIIQNSIKRLKSTGIKTAIFCLTELTVTTTDKKTADPYWKTRQFIENSQRALYTFTQLKSDKEQTKVALSKLQLIAAGQKELNECNRAIEDGTAISKGIELTCDLANLPPNICTPSYLADQAEALGKDEKRLTVTILDEAAMKKLGMNSLLSVSQGSRQPGKLISMEYKGAKKEQKPVVLVGKGVTFDTGGISLKPPSAMDEMKYDMCGAASVFGVIKAVIAMQLPINVVGIVPTVENMPDGQATRPGDIYKSMSGQTIEVLNTDAEGRLILCDALTYSERFSPDTVIDIATLTGACVIALGKHASGLMSNHQPLANDLLAAGEKSFDRAWQLPLWEEYQAQLKSPFADMANIGGREAGTITAACFLARFTKQYHWAHLDIAGTAWLSGSNKGATGRPVTLLVQYLLNKINR